MEIIIDWRSISREAGARNTTSFGIESLGLNFPASVAEKEMAYYRANQGEFGLALDNRATYTKLDWVLWTATLTQKREDFDALLKPVIRFIQETPDRSPLTDWYETKSAKKVGFTARPVVGGVFLQCSTISRRGTNGPLGTRRKRRIGHQCRNLLSLPRL